jgi:hypothetical protein
MRIFGGFILPLASGKVQEQPFWGPSLNLIKILHFKLQFVANPNI